MIHMNRLNSIVPSMMRVIAGATGRATVANAAEAEAPRNRAARRAAAFGRKPATGRERYAKRLRARVARGGKGAARKLARQVAA